MLGSQDVFGRLCLRELNSTSLRLTGQTERVNGFLEEYLRHLIAANQLIGLIFWILPNSVITLN